MKKIILSIVLCLFSFNVSIAQACFSEATNFAAGTNPRNVISADFNNDGKLDLVTGNSNGGGFSILLGNGSGGFSVATNFEEGYSVDSVISADFNRDGKRDLAAVSGGGSVEIFLGNGSGGFSPATFFNLFEARSAIDIISADFNGDGKMDLATANSDSNNISVIFGNGLGSFSVATNFAVGTNPNSVITADFNKDGKMDLATSNKASNNISVILGNGLGSFSAATNFDVSASPYFLISADFNNDGIIDIAASIDNNISVLLGNGMGGMGTAINTSTSPDTPSSIVCFKVQGWEGAMDMVFSKSGSGSLSVLYNANNGRFFSPQTFTRAVSGVSPSSVINADFNGDGKMDLASANPNSNNVSIFLGLLTIETFQTNVTCNGAANGSASVGVTCGKPGYSYSWNTSPIQTTAKASGLLAGTYIVTVTDSDKTVKTASVIITQPSLITATYTTSPNTKCSGTCDGTVTINATGGKLPYSYKWNDLANNQTSQTATGLCPDKYTVKITDANGCTFNKEVVLAADSGFNSQVYLTNIAAVDQVNVAPAFASYYSYNLPAKITPNPTNLRNFVDPGKKARFKVECTNKKANGQSIVSGVCQVRSNCPYITITDASSALNNIGWNNKAWSADEFEIDIKPNTPPGTIAYIDFIVLENGVEYPTTCIPLPITPLNYSPTTSATIDDDDNPDSKGNDNDICEPNEIIEFYPWLDNVSTLNAEFVRGRFENLDNLSYINIWNNKAGVNTTVFDSTWWNFSFAKPSIINSNSKDMTPEFDFVFNYNNAAKVNNFKLHMVMAGGFKLFPGNALSLVQWSLPYVFNSSSLAIDDFVTDNSVQIYPNPTNSFLTVKSSNKAVFNKIVITDLTGKKLLEQTQNTNQINVQNLASGIYMLEATSNSKKSTTKFIKQ